MGQRTHQTFIFTQLILVSVLSTRGIVTCAGLYALLDVSGFPVSEVELADVFTRVEVVAVGLE